MIVFDYIPTTHSKIHLRANRFLRRDICLPVWRFVRNCLFARLSRQGVSRLLRRVSRRALQIYTYYLITSPLIAVSRDVIAIPDNHQAFIELREDPLAAIQSAIFL